ncbi:hypothetical protein HK104_009415 [Borealophlyctis nickersoniae]|nr:hypothetical protein HK104_009415 [Borealophlyctis nickersoniae]
MGDYYPPEYYAGAETGYYAPPASTFDPAADPYADPAAYAHSATATYYDPSSYYPPAPAAPYVSTYSAGPSGPSTFSASAGPTVAQMGPVAATVAESAPYPAGYTVTSEEGAAPLPEGYTPSAATVHVVKVGAEDKKAAAVAALPQPPPMVVSGVYTTPGEAAAAAASGKEGKKRKKIIRAAGGEVWDDQTLLEWDDNDFRLFCGDLGNEVNDELLTKAFQKYPSMQKARVVRDKRTSKTKGYGFVSFKDPNDFVKALREMNGKYVGNRPIKLRKSTWQDRTVDPKSLRKVIGGGVMKAKK